MVSLPHVPRNTLQSKYEKPLYYFKDVKLKMDGFKFEEAVEFDVKDPLPLTTTTYAKDKKVAAMNDLFFVYMSNNKEIATIVLRRNVQYVRDGSEAASHRNKSSHVSEDGEKTEGPDCCSKFFRFCKLVEKESIRIRFDSDVNKILLNGDQIIFMLVDRVVIYTLFSTSTIEAKALDIAVDRYLYILTEDAVLIYSDKLVKKIKIDKKCRFVVPTPSHIFVVRRAVVYKIAGDVAEPYFDALSYIDGCVFDEKFMYLASDYGLFKVGLYDREVARIQYAMWSLKLYLCCNHIVLFNSNSGLLFIDKNDFSRFSARNLDISLCSIATYRNTIAYICSKEVIFCEYVHANGNLELADPSPSERVESGTTPTEEIGRTRSEHLAPYPYSLYGMTAFNRKPSAFSKLLGFKSDPEAPRIAKMHEVRTARSPRAMSDKRAGTEHAQTNSVSRLLPSPALTQVQADHKASSGSPKRHRCILDAESTGNPYTALFGQNERFVEDPHIAVAIDEDSLSENDMARIKHEVKKAHRYLQRQACSTEESSSESEEDGLFFDELENQGLEIITHPVLQSIPETFKSKKKCRAAGKVPMYNVFKRVYSRLGLNHPITYSVPLEAVARGKMRAIVCSRRQTAYPKSYFFIENHFDYFKRMFNPRNNEDERPYRGVIYSFIDDEFKRILGYRQAVQSRSEQKLDPVKKKQGGF
ncbi:uncharacterized protein VICG_02112 [Vittaforma corneae ATCC 50505]|uniref:CNH domain-containing protein n=1 Tax=Vittaforma corneae (strain ATCC 50505) TaxID=993615 RepID=L2GKN2_VITCO|nr:uncharacterized protein VICG_02112 [Vittaforma corneae ATCC 50505]ELA40852.1 hypothetical protein VICG_02112 [Vittaforma corneae ATCC 50505]